MSIFIMVQTEGCLFQAKLSIFTWSWPFWNQLCEHSCWQQDVPFIDQNSSSCIEILWYASLDFFCFLIFPNWICEKVLDILDATFLKFAFADWSLLFYVFSSGMFTWAAMLHLSDLDCLTPNFPPQMSQHGKNRGQFICTLMLWRQVEWRNQVCIHNLHQSRRPGYILYADLQTHAVMIVLMEMNMHLTAWINHSQQQKLHWFGPKY